ncbi:MAG: 16S rRNA processing protein RimM [Bacillales bacterium]|nr:16S rRNA processing protein RimM [Bacillales bacterium]
MEYNLVGKIIKPHALKGEVKIKTDSSFIEERFKEGALLYIKNKESFMPLEVKSHRNMKDYELVSFKGYDTVESLTPLIGSLLYGEKDESLIKNGGHFYSDLIGMHVFQYNVCVGVVKDIVSYPQSDYLLVQEKEAEKLVPILNEFIDSIDDKEKIIYIVDMEGLL